MLDSRGSITASLAPDSFAFDDALGVRIEVVARFEVGGDEQDEVGVGMVGAGPVVGLPDGVAEAGARRADVGVAIVAVHAPGLQDAFDIALVARPADVVDDFVAPVLLPARVRMRPAISSTASFQPIFSHLPSPRAPTRCSG